MIFANLFLLGTFFYGTFLLNCSNGTGHDEQPPNSSLPRNATHRSTAGNIADLGETTQTGAFPPLPGMGVRQPAAVGQLPPLPLPSTSSSSSVSSLSASAFSSSLQAHLMRSPSASLSMPSSSALSALPLSLQARLMSVGYGDAEASTSTSTGSGTQRRQPLPQLPPINLPSSSAPRLVRDGQQASSMALSLPASLQRAAIRLRPQQTISSFTGLLSSSLSSQYAAAGAEIAATAHLTHTQLIHYFMQKALAQRFNAPPPQIPLPAVRSPAWQPQHQQQQQGLIPNPSVHIELPIEGEFVMDNLDIIVNVFYNMPRMLLRVVADMSTNPLDTEAEKLAYHLRRFQEHIYDGRNPQYYIGTIENTGDGVSDLDRNGVVDHFHKFSQTQIAGYFGLYDTHNDFDVARFRRLRLNQFAFVRNNQFLMHSALQNLFYSFNEATRQLAINNLGNDILARCENLSQHENANILCLIAHAFAFAVEFHAQSTEFMLFNEQVFTRMERLRPQQMESLVTRQHRYHAFNQFLAWLKMKARASWMEDSALAIFAQMARSNPFGVIIDPNLSAESNLRAHLKKLRRSYTNLAKMFIWTQKLVPRQA